MKAQSLLKMKNKEDLGFYFSVIKFLPAAKDHVDEVRNYKFSSS